MGALQCKPLAVIKNEAAAAAHFPRGKAKCVYGPLQLQTMIRFAVRMLVLVTGTCVMTHAAFHQLPRQYIDCPANKNVTARLYIFAKYRLIKQLSGLPCKLQATQLQRQPSHCTSCTTKTLTANAATEHAATIMLYHEQALDAIVVAHILQMPQTKPVGVLKWAVSDTACATTMVCWMPFVHLAGNVIPA